jgi:hypothetical protein
MHFQHPGMERNIIFKGSGIKGKDIYELSYEI